MMPPELKIFRDLESQVAAEKGEFVVFALVVHDELPDHWALIVSAPWIGSDHSRAVRYFVDVIKSRFGAEHLIRLTRIVVVDPQDAGVQALNEEVQVEHGAVEVRETTLFGFLVKRAFIITSKSPASAAA